MAHLEASGRTLDLSKHQVQRVSADHAVHMCATDEVTRSDRVVGQSDKRLAYIVTVTELLAKFQVKEEVLPTVQRSRRHDTTCTMRQDDILCKTHHIVNADHGVVLTDHSDRITLARHSLEAVDRAAVGKNHVFHLPIPRESLAHILRLDLVAVLTQAVPTLVTFDEDAILERALCLNTMCHVAPFVKICPSF